MSVRFLWFLWWLGANDTDLDRPSQHLPADTSFTRTSSSAFKAEGNCNVYCYYSRILFATTSTVPLILCGYNKPNSVMDLPILSGSFASLSLFLLTLSISPSNSDYKYTLTHQRTIPGHGPHQYLHYHAPSSTIYATSWALPPALHVFSPSLSHVNSTPITAVSSYITSHGSCLYSVGGPTGEVHSLSPLNQVQPILYVPLSALPTTDKTRVALRTGSHAIEIHASTRKAYVPVLGTDSIYVYSLLDNDHLQEESVFKAPEGSAPRHLKIHPNGQILYVVTEHRESISSNIIDNAYDFLQITPC